MVVLSQPGEVMFPPRLRFNARVALNSQLTFTANANQYQYLDINNPITVAASQNMSGLAWLISGQQTNGSSYAPYVLGIVRRAHIEVYAKTSASKCRHRSISGFISIITWYFCIHIVFNTS